MTKPSKESIIATYNDMVRSAGRVVGETVFARETGFSAYYWRGGYWRSWSALQSDAGHTPNKPTPKTPEDELLSQFAELALELGSIPTQADLTMKHRENPSFPEKGVFSRWGNRDELLEKVAQYCEDKERYEAVLALLTQSTSKVQGQRLESLQVKGFVYLLRSGKNYKLGRTNAIGRRLRELAIQLPQKPDTVHVIETDDPEGIEQYWHRRFAEKRQGGEWFTLTADDVKAFKRRRFQ